VGSSSELIADDVLLAGGTFTIDEAVLNANYVLIESLGLLRGRGGIIAATDVYNAGRLQVGNTAGGSLGILGITGDYTQDAAGHIDFDIVNGVGHDLLNVTGHVTFGGTLNVASPTPVAAPPNSYFTLITFGSMQGQFAAYNLPALQQSMPPPYPQLVWNWRYNDPAGTFSLWVVYA
jgi:hypothetical protein